MNRVYPIGLSTLALNTESQYESYAAIMRSRSASPVLSWGAAWYFAPSSPICCWIFAFKSFRAEPLAPRTSGEIVIAPGSSTNTGTRLPSIIIRAITGFSTEPENTALFPSTNTESIFSPVSKLIITAGWPSKSSGNSALTV